MPDPTVHKIPIPFGTLGMDVWIPVVRFGRSGCRPRAYIQGGLHADELPGMIIAARTIELLTAEDTIRGEIIIVPVSNPLGLHQSWHGTLQGRFDIATGQNFNRGFANPGLFLKSCRNDIEDNAPNYWFERIVETAQGSQADALRSVLIGLSLGSDIVIDLHTDFKAVKFLYMWNKFWPAGGDLASCLGVDLAIVWDTPSADMSFEDACISMWADENMATSLPIQRPTLIATVELMGRSDFSRSQVDESARGLLQFLRGRGFLGRVDRDPASFSGKVGDIRNVETVFSTISGPITFLKNPGDSVRKGEVICTIFRLDELMRLRETEVRSTHGGLLFSHIDQNFVFAGQLIAKILTDKAVREPSDGALDL